VTAGPPGWLAADPHQHSHNLRLTQQCAKSTPGRLLSSPPLMTVTIQASDQHRGDDTVPVPASVDAMWDLTAPPVPGRVASVTIAVYDET
jgi:hypothetical protein